LYYLDNDDMLQL